MKKTFVFLTAAGLVLGLNYRAATSSSQPPTGHTGAPSELTCAASGCHSGNLNTGTGSVQILNAPAAYIPGTTYTMQVQVNLAGRTRAGFELTALNNQNQKAGNLALVSSANTALQNSGGRQYLSHNNASSNNTWSFTWTAPAAGTGLVKFYVAGNAANGDGNTTGDFIYTSSLNLNEATASGIAENSEKHIKFFPNPTADMLNLTFAEKASNLKILDITGREVQAQDKVEMESQLDVSHLPNGTYFLQVEQNKLLQLKRFVVQH